MIFKNVWFNLFKMKHNTLKGDIMTQKELLYLEDAINHEKSLATVSSLSASYLEDDTLIEFLMEQSKKHEAFAKKLKKKLEGEAE